MPPSRRRKGTGGLWTRTVERLNPRTGEYTTVEIFHAAKEVPHPTHPSKRKWVTGSGATPQEAYRRLDKNLVRHYQKMAIPLTGSARFLHGGQRLSEYLLEWHGELNPERVSPQLQRKYWQYMNNHVIPHVGTIPLKDLRYQELQALFEKILPSKTKRGTTDPLLGTNARRNIYKVLNLALKVAVKKGLIDRNPLELVTPPRYIQPQENIPQMMHIARAMFLKMEKENPDAYDHFLISLMGLRRGERLGLHFSDLTLTGQSSSMTIRHQLAWITGEGLVIKNTTKSGKPRVVTLTEPWLSNLKRLKARRRQQQKNPNFNPEPQFADLVFLKDNGKPWSLNEDNEYWNDIESTYNVNGPRIRGHALRHIAATRMADAGVELEVAQALLGHENFSIASYYRRITASKQRGQVTEYGKEWTQNPS